MNKFHQFLMLILLILLSCDEKNEDNDQSENEIVTFIEQFGGDKDDSGYAVKQTLDGGYIITGATYSFGDISEDVWVIKTDSLGNEVWSKTYGGSEKDGGIDICQTNDSGFIILGHTLSYNTFGARDIWLIKTNNHGEEEWNRTFGGERYDNAYDVVQTSDFGFVFTGTLQTSSFALYVVKTNSEGIEQWSYIDTLFGRSSGSSIIQSNDGGYVVIGTKNDIVYDDIYLLKLYSDGNEKWMKNFGDNSIQTGIDIQQTSDGGYIILGSNFTNATGTYGDIWIIKTDSNGEEEWNKIYGGENNDSGSSIQITDDGGYIISGSTQSFGAQSRDIWLLKLNTEGDEEWNRTYGGIYWDVGKSVQQTSDGGYILTGTTELLLFEDDDLILIKTDSEGNTVEYP